jgi:peptidoglycan/LPS O-acetylase OafA/YrhL
MYNWDYLSLTRFLLAFVVMASHFTGYIEDIGVLHYIQLFGSLEAILGFLLISGFSIGHSILRNKEQYFYRRAQRIYPVYLASMVLNYILFPEALSPEFIGIIFLNVIFLNQLITATSYVGPAWSLSLEVWLYALAPILVKASYRVLLILIYTSFILYTIYTGGRTLFHWPYHSASMYGINLFTLSYIWIIGFALAVFKEHFEKIKLHIALIFIGHFVLVFLIQTAYRFKNHQMLEYIEVDLFSFLLRGICLFLIYFVILYNHKLPTLSITSKKVFNFLGNISYPLYLVHFSIIQYCIHQNYTNWLVITLTCLTTACFMYLSIDFYSKKRKVV